MRTLPARAAAAPATLLALLPLCLGAPQPLQVGGVIALYVQDAPTENFTSVFVEIRSVVAEGPGGPIVLIDEPHTLDLLQYRGGNRSFLGSAPVAAGAYGALWVELGDAYGIDTNASRVPFPAAAGPVRVETEGNVEEAREAQLTLDFDLDASLSREDDGWAFLPVIHPRWSDASGARP